MTKKRLIALALASILLFNEPVNVIAAENSVSNSIEASDTIEEALSEEAIDASTVQTEENIITEESEKLEEQTTSDPLEEQTEDDSISEELICPEEEIIELNNASYSATYTQISGAAPGKIRIRVSLSGYATTETKATIGYEYTDELYGHDCGYSGYLNPGISVNLSTDNSSLGTKKFTKDIDLDGNFLSTKEYEISFLINVGDTAIGKQTITAKPAAATLSDDAVKLNIEKVAANTIYYNIKTPNGKNEGINIVFVPKLCPLAQTISGTETNISNRCCYTLASGQTYTAFCIYQGKKYYSKEVTLPSGGLTLGLDTTQKNKVGGRDIYRTFKLSSAKNKETYGISVYCKKATESEYKGLYLNAVRKSDETDSRLKPENSYTRGYYLDDILEPNTKYNLVWVTSNAGAANSFYAETITTESDPFSYSFGEITKNTASFNIAYDSTKSAYLANDSYGVSIYYKKKNSSDDYTFKNAVYLKDENNWKGTIQLTGLSDSTSYSAYFRANPGTKEPIRNFEFSTTANTTKPTSLELSSSSISYILHDTDPTRTVSVRWATPSDARKDVTWKSSDTSIVTVEATSATSAKVTRKNKAGTAVITATSVFDNSVVATCNVKVGDYVFGECHDTKTLDSYELTNGNYRQFTKYIGEDYSLRTDVQVFYYNGETYSSIGTSNLTVEIEDENVVKWDTQYRRFILKGAGKSKATVKFQGYTFNLGFEVTEVQKPAKTISAISNIHTKLKDISQYLPNTYEWENPEALITSGKKVDDYTYQFLDKKQRPINVMVFTASDFSVSNALDSTEILIGDGVYKSAYRIDYKYNCSDSYSIFRTEIIVDEGLLTKRTSSNFFYLTAKENGRYSFTVNLKYENEIVDSITKTVTAVDDPFSYSVKSVADTYAEFEMALDTSKPRPEEDYGQKIYLLYKEKGSSEPLQYGSCAVLNANNNYKIIDKLSGLEPNRTYTVKLSINNTDSDSRPLGMAEITTRLVKPTSMKLNKSSLTFNMLNTSKTEQLSVSEISPADAKNEVTWTSSNEKVAKVDKNGNVTAVGVGTATITATSTADTSIKASCRVNVITYKVGHMVDGAFVDDEYSQSYLELTKNEGEDTEFPYEIGLYQYNGSQYTIISDATVKVEDETIVSYDVDKKRFIGKGSGKTFVSFTKYGKTLKVGLSILENPIDIANGDDIASILLESEDVPIDQDKRQIIVNLDDVQKNVTKYTLNAVSTNKKGESVSKKLVWKVTDTSVAKITPSKDGTSAVITVVGDGHCKITASSTDASKAMCSYGLEIRDYTPRLKKNTAAVNLAYDYAGTGASEAYRNGETIEIRPIYGVSYTVNGVFSDKDATTQSELFGIKKPTTYNYAIKPLSQSIKAGTYNVFVKITVTKDTMKFTKIYPVKVSVYNKLPKVTGAMTESLNLFYKDATGTVRFTTSNNATISSLNWVPNEEGFSVSDTWTSTVNNKYYKYIDVTAKDGVTAAAKKGYFTITLEGYQGEIKLPFTVKTITKAPVISTELKRTFISRKNGKNGDFFYLYNDTDKGYQQIDAIQPVTQGVEFTISDENDSKQKINYKVTADFKAGKAYFYVTNSNWRDKVKVTHTIIEQKPKATLQTSSLTINKKLDSVATTKLVLNSTNYSGYFFDIELKGKNAISKAVEQEVNTAMHRYKSGAYMGGVIAIDSTLLSKGVYSFDVIASVSSDDGFSADLPKTTLKITVIDKAVTAKTLVTSQANLAVDYSSAVIRPSFSNLAAGYNLAGMNITGEGSEDFTVGVTSTGVYNKTLNTKINDYCLRLTNPENATIGKKYTFNVKYYLRNDNSDILIVNSTNKITIAPYLGKVSLELAKNQITLFASASYPQESIYISKCGGYNVSSVNGSFDVNKDGINDFEATQNNRYIVLKLTDPDGVVANRAGKTYTVPVTVTLTKNGRASQTVKTNIKVTVKR